MKQSELPHELQAKVSMGPCDRVRFVYSIGIACYSYPNVIIAKCSRSEIHYIRHADVTL